MTRSYKIWPRKLIYCVDNQGSDTRRGVGIVMLGLIGQYGPLLGTNIYPKAQGPQYVKGMSICAAFIFLNVILACVLRTLLVWENKKLSEKYGAATCTEVNGEQETEKDGEENYGPSFRYVL